MPPRLSIHRFSHQAMGTFFEVLIAGEEASYAGQAAREAFVEIDRLERLFSRFDPGSDIARVNRLRPGEEAVVGLDAFDCLSMAEEARRETGGAFDVNVRAGNRGGPPESAAPLMLSGGSGRFIVSRPGRESAFQAGLDLDLGGIGKGYALDAALEILKAWSLDNALLNGGTSTVLALGSPPPEENTGTHHLSVLKSGQLSDVSPNLFGWPVGVGGGWPEAPGRVFLSGRAMSGSGTEVKGQHVLDPRTGRPATGHLAAWASHPRAALADAFSTAFLVMAPAEVEDFCARHPEVWGCVVAGYGDVRVFNSGLLA
jgi:thiamine biosynthesis lipoprotein